jgi:hypothetical protein
MFLECFTLTDLGKEVRGQFTDALRSCSSFELTNSRVASVGLADSVRTYTEQLLKSGNKRLILIRALSS